MPEEITTTAEAHALSARVTALLDGGDPDAAIALAEAVTGDDALVTQLRAWAYTEGGQQKEDWEATSHGRDLWRALAGRAHDFGYNLANAEQALFELAVKEHGHLKALERHHEHLERARRGFEGVADDADAPDSLKLQALTNLGNSYDRMGRDLDALEVWEWALGTDSGFAMALGNVGVALARVASFMGEHSATVRQQAVEALDAALAKPEDIVARGGPRALEHFKRTRAGLPEAKRIPKGRTRFDEPYLEWCRRHELFLHVSHRCLREEVKLLDPLFFRGLLVGIEDEDQQRVKDLVDAFNSIKQAYVSARYLTWLATASDAPLREEMEGLRKRVGFLDSLEYTRFGIRTGIAVHAFTAATNVLDQVASFVHLYLESGRRVSDVYFKRLWHRQSRREMDKALAEHLQPQSFNRGLLALCDLASDLDQDRPLARLLERRHAATHRFLVVHEMVVDDDAGDWLDHVEWGTLVEQSIAQLRIGRAALVYLARLIDIREAQRRRADPAPRLPLPLQRMADEAVEIG